MFVADNGANWFVSGAPDPRWNDDELVSGFQRVHGSDIEVVGLPPPLPFRRIPGATIIGNPPPMPAPRSTTGSPSSGTVPIPMPIPRR